MASLLAKFTEVENTFDGDVAVSKLFVPFADVPIYAAAAYLAMVFLGQQYMKARPAFNLKPLFIAWNLILAIFSIRGAMVVVPYLFETFQREGFRYTVCQDQHDWWQKKGAVSFWVVMFVLSKIPELIDTAFLVYQKKPVIFLHWYHHATVMLYCWFSCVQPNAVAVWFCAMNYVVHSVMYSYYFLMSASDLTRAMVKPIAQSITTLQIGQMVVGLLLVFEAQRAMFENADGCAGVSPTINRAALLMYASYFVLFAKFFVDTYVHKRGKLRTSLRKDPKQLE